ncbi:MAG: DUF1553 domain-containing protein [Planctomycetota bacterium]|nr:MAG: DUF1553 domain-containing protein [Planctomycetota bacterium]REJ96779.1 MAG: DUF1553 domain-containing protein [Planctomycetota bacterium]REK20224.1 MAG: DUF1553 domain-containing protein [Planctomycetota bacterium]REK35322.1 MAG: DUF1553 domain-containing protein [Planctomycetota bacterium]
MLGCLFAFSLSLGPAFAGEISYNRDVRPILADNCFHCHGPDEAARQADLRLDVEDSATAERDGGRVIDPNRPDESELLRRVSSDDESERMPPDEPLDREEIEILRQWIADGAEYEPHWSFVAPQRPVPPELTGHDWPRNPVDRFVLQRLLAEGLEPTGQASPSTLIRRVTIDLTGLPPTLEEIDAFERDWQIDSEAAYSKLVDRLLASPHYGERMAVGWLDAARYADTNGYFTDENRTMWPWRDWVINAFNENMPFDRFTIEQLAGDLLPDATIDQQVATGFNRNHMVNNETGIIEEEFRVEYVVDRVDTTATVWMGLTLACARCHDHKYDPISQKDFYRFFAFFNNVPERGLSGSGGNSTPVLTVATQQQQQQLQHAQEALAAAQADFSETEAQLEAAQTEWEQTVRENLPEPAAGGLARHFPLDEIEPARAVGNVAVAEGMVNGAMEFQDGACLEIDDDFEFERKNAFSAAAWIFAKGAGCVLSRTDDANEMRGFDVTLRKGQAIVNLVHRWNRNAIQVATASAVPSGRWVHLTVTYDGSGVASGVTVYVDGEPQPVTIAQDNLTESIRNEEPIRLGRRQASASYSGMIDDVRLYERALAADEVRDLAATQFLRGIVSRPEEARTTVQSEKLRSWFIEHVARDDLAEKSRRLDELRTRVNTLQSAMPTTMVMQEAEEPREAFVLVRGQYDAHGDAVDSGVPPVLQPELPAAQNRLALARWLVDPAHPLTARVTVNRLWQQLFGAGIVRTADDFGTQGEWPTHPELLDWLAVELIESNWDLQHILKLIVTSAAYRQSSECPPELWERDRENRLLARGPRFRMNGETLRDNALAISGLMVEEIGGPPVKPYQPAGLWEEVSYDSDKSYAAATGAALYRRSLYTFWKRQSPPPNMLVFDAPTRETCVVQRSRTNTPLQALVLMNDPTFIEASRNLAERMLLKAGDTAEEKVTFAFRAATARYPDADETAILIEQFEAQTQTFNQNPGDALRLLSVGESPRNESLDPAELAAWTTVASMILCLDETVTRP